MTEERQQRFEQVIRQRQPDVTVVMEDIHDPHNVSAMLRSCDAAGVMNVHLLYSNEEFPDIGKKSSASSKKWVDRTSHASVQECYGALRKDGFAIYATRLNPKARSLFELDLTRPSAFVFGNEHRGVSDEAARTADTTVYIPMMGMIESLNVSVACAVTLFEVVRQRLAAGFYATPRLSDDEQDALMRDWAKRDMERYER